METSVFFERIRKLSYALALCFLVPLFAHYTARLIQGTSTKVEQEKIATLRAEIEDLGQKELSLMSALDKKPNEELSLRLEAIRKEQKSRLADLKELENICAYHEPKHSQLTFYVTALVGLMSLIFGTLSTTDYLAAGATIGGTISLMVGYGSHWGQLNDFLKVLSLFLALLIIVASSYRFTRRPD